MSSSIPNQQDVKDPGTFYGATIDTNRTGAASESHESEIGSKDLTSKVPSLDTETGAGSSKAGFGTTVSPVNQLFTNTEDLEQSPETNGQKTPKRLPPFRYLFSKHFLEIFLLGQVLSMCIVCTNTMTSLMSERNVSIPAFQSLFVYVLLALIYLPYTFYRYGFKKTVWDIMIKQGWKYFILAFTDCQGNYFIVKAYDYTNMLSATLLDNTSIVFVVLISFIFLKVRYHWTQVIGIIVCIGGSVLIVVSDYLTGKNNYTTKDHIRGDLYVILSAFCYGFSNVLEEFLVSKKPLYEVVGMLGFFGTFILGVQCAIFERNSLENAQWSSAIGGYLTGFTLAMILLYSTAPILFRMSSSAFYNLSLLTSDFWALLIGIKVFGYYVYWLYPIGFVLTIGGVVIYYLIPKSYKAEAEKPWLGENQEGGIVGVGTAKTADTPNDSNSDANKNDDCNITSTEQKPTYKNLWNVFNH